MASLCYSMIIETFACSTTDFSESVALISQSCLLTSSSSPTRIIIIIGLSCNYLVWAWVQSCFSWCKYIHITSRIPLAAIAYGSCLKIISMMHGVDYLGFGNLVVFAVLQAIQQEIYPLRKFCNFNPGPMHISCIQILHHRNHSASKWFGYTYVRSPLLPMHVDTKNYQ